MKRKVYTRVAKKARKLMGWKGGRRRKKHRRSRKKRGWKKGGRGLKTRKKRGGVWKNWHDSSKEINEIEKKQDRKGHGKIYVGKAPAQEGIHFHGSRNNSWLRFKIAGKHYDLIVDHRLSEEQCMKARDAAAERAPWAALMIDDIMDKWTGSRTGLVKELYQGDSDSDQDISLHGLFNHIPEETQDNLEKIKKKEEKKAQNQKLEEAIKQEVLAAEKKEAKRVAQRKAEAESRQRERKEDEATRKFARHVQFARENKMRVKLVRLNQAEHNGKIVRIREVLKNGKFKVSFEGKLNEIWEIKRQNLSPINSKSDHDKKQSYPRMPPVPEAEVTWDGQRRISAEVVGEYIGKLNAHVLKHGPPPTKKIKSRLKLGSSAKALRWNKQTKQFQINILPPPLPPPVSKKGKKKGKKKRRGAQQPRAVQQPRAAAVTPADSGGPGIGLCPRCGGMLRPPRGALWFDCSICGLGLEQNGGGKRTRKKRGGDPRRYEEKLFFTTMAGDEFSIALMPPYDSDDGGTAIGVEPDNDREIARWMTFEQIHEVLLKYLEDLNRKAAERGDGGKYTIDRHTNIHLIFPNRQVAALGSTEWRGQNPARRQDPPRYWFKLDEVLDEGWVDKRILKSRLDPEDPKKRVPYYSVDQPGRLIHIFLSHTPGEGAPSSDLEARERRRLELLRQDGWFEGAVWDAEEGWHGGGRRKTKRKKRGGRRKKRKTRRKRAGGTGPDGPPEEGSQEANLRREQWGMGGENRIEHPLWPWQIEARGEAKDRATEAARDKNKEEREMEEFIKAQDAILFYKTKWPGNWDPNGLPIISKRELFNSLINLFKEAIEIKRKQYEEKGKTYQFTDKEIEHNVTVSLSSLPDVVSWEEFREWHKGERGQKFDEYREYVEKHPEIIAEYNARLSKPRPVPKE